MYKSVIKCIILIFMFVLGNINCVASEKEIKIISLSPAVTEIIYAIGAQDNLIAVSTMCDYPYDVRNKNKAGNYFFVNKEKIIKYNPDYVFTDISSLGLAEEFKKTNIKFIYLKFETIDEIYKNIIHIGKRTKKEKEAAELIKKIQKKILNLNKTKQKRILYLIQTEPMISAGSRSFINDVIIKSGNISVTSDLNTYYPVITEEYAIKSNPDIIILNYGFKLDYLNKLFPKTKIITLTKEESDIINRPGARIYEAVKFFNKIN